MLDLTPFAEGIERQLEVTASLGSDQTRQLAANLAAPLGAAVRLALQDAITAAVAEIAAQLPPGMLDLRLSEDGLEFVVATDGTAPAVAPVETEGGPAARVNLRLPEDLKSRAERAARQDGLSVNAWLVRAVAASVERAESPTGPAPRVVVARNSYTGWVR